MIPFTALIGAGLWNQWRIDQASAIERALNEARLLAAQVDDHIGNLDNLMMGLSRAVSANPADVLTNDALLQKVKAELPGFVSNVLVFAPDGTNIGTSADPSHGRPYAAPRAYFQQVLAGKHLGIGDVVRTRFNDQWVITVARPIADASGRLLAVLAVGTRLEHFQEALRVRALPAGSVVRIVDDQAIVIAHTHDGANWVGRDLSKLASITRHITAREAKEVTRWSDGIERITGSSTAHDAPWLISVGLPTDIAFAAFASRLAWGGLLTTGSLMAAFVIAWMLSGRIVRPLLQLQKDASKLADGDLSHRTGVRTQDELGVLAQAFNRMAASLEQRQDEAERAAEEVRQTKDTLAAVIDASPVAIICSDPERRIFLWNRSAEKIFGYTAEEALRTAGQSFTAQGQRQIARTVPSRIAAAKRCATCSIKRLRKDGSPVDVRAAAAPMYNPDGSVRGVARAYEDITDRVRAEEQLERVAHYDQLTGLPNRLTLQKELGRLLAGAGCTKPTAIALFDLDGFKDVNDTLGHSTGDQLLVEVGHRLTEVAGDRGTVCRLGGDEFVVILPDCGDPLVDRRDWSARCSSGWRSRSRSTIMSCMSAAAPASPSRRTTATTVDELIANADLALYQAKSDGGRIYRFFLPVLRAQAQARRSLDLELRRAFAENEFELYFQPQVRLLTKRVVGAEALIRWRHPERGMLAPGAFIDTLGGKRDRARSQPLDLRTACEKIAAWRAAGLPLGRIGGQPVPEPIAPTRTSERHRRRACAIPACRPRCWSSKLPRTSRSTSSDAAVLQKLHEKGVKLAFDDFGTGYASLSYLTRFPLTRIKIDRSFVGKITDDAGDAAIVRSLIAMAHNLGLAGHRRGRRDRRTGGIPAAMNDARKRRATSTPSRCRRPSSRPICAPTSLPPQCRPSRSGRIASSTAPPASPPAAAVCLARNPLDYSKPARRNAFR